MDASGEKVAMLGRVFFKDRTGTKDITKVHFRFGAVTKAGGSTVLVSLQDVDLATGPPAQPDGTADQSITIANADASFASNTWYSTGALSANRTVTHGDLLAVVWAITDFGGADSVIINGLTSDGNSTHMPSTALFTASWALNTSAPNVILEFTDGSFGCLDATRLAIPAASAINTHTFSQNTASADEYALKFQFPFPCKVDGAWVVVLFASSTSNFSLILYDSDGTSALVTVTVDANAIAATSSGRIYAVDFPSEVTLLANTTYRLSVRPTVDGQNVTVYSADVSTANMFQAFPGGTTWTQGTQVNVGGTWTDTATRRMFYGLRISSLDDGVQSSEGPLVGGRLIG